MSLHAEIGRLQRLRTELNGHINAVGHPLGQALFRGGDADAVGLPQVRQALIAAYQGLVSVESITDGLIAALSNIEVRLHQLNNAGPAAGLHH